MAKKTENRYVSKFVLNDVEAAIASEICARISEIDFSFKYRIYRNNEYNNYLLCVFDDDKDRLHKRSLRLRQYLLQNGVDAFYHIDKIGGDENISTSN